MDLNETQRPLMHHLLEACYVEIVDEPQLILIFVIYFETLPTSSFSYYLGSYIMNLFVLYICVCVCVCVCVFITF
jgi:hypothetical protein